MGCPGGERCPPSLAAPRTQMAEPWQPLRRHLRLRTRCPRPPPGTGRSVRGEPARGPPAGWIRGIPGATAPPAPLGCGGMRVGSAAARGALARGHPKPWEDPGVQGSSQHLNLCIGLAPGPPALDPAPVWQGWGQPASPHGAKGGRAEGSEHPTGTPSVQGQAAHPRQRQRVLQRARKRPLDFITHFLPWLPGDKRLEETGFHFPRPRQGAPAPPREALAPRSPGGPGDAWRQGSLSPTRADSSPGRIRPLARGRNNFGTALARGRLSGAGSETRSFIAVGPPAPAAGGFGVRPWRGQGLGGAKPTVPPTARGLRAPAPPGMGMVLPRLGSGLQRARPTQPAPPSPIRSGVREGAPHHPAFHRVTSAAGTDRPVPGCARSPRPG